MILNINEIKKKEKLLNATVLNIPVGITHIIGRNGVGKSVLAKHIYAEYSKQYTIDLIGSYTNLPHDMKIKDILKYSNGNKQLIEILGIDNINTGIRLKNLSDGQKQKVKLYSFLNVNSDLIILDEFTNALDVSAVKELYSLMNEVLTVFPKLRIINITHNMSDLKFLKGDILVFSEKKLIKFEDVDKAISFYIEE